LRRQVFGEHRSVMAWSISTAAMCQVAGPHQAARIACRAKKVGIGDPP
jgi:hypothetical protein